jgi:hypothetical protein
MDGVTTTVKVAHVRLCHPRETQEIVFDARDRALRSFGRLRARRLRQFMDASRRARWSSGVGGLDARIYLPERRAPGLDGNPRLLASQHDRLCGHVADR